MNTRIYLIFILIFVSVGIFAGGILYVPKEYPTIQSAMDAALVGDTVHVAKGV